MRPEPGQVVGGKYRIVRLLGEGGMGAVYEATHEVLGASVALKFVQPELASRPELIARFMQEARVAATVQSAHVARVTDVDRVPDGSAYIVMELLDGESLQQRLDFRAPLPRDEAIDVTLQILLGLETAHERGVVHRDLKPDNVFIVHTPGGGLVKLLDFGIAKLRDRASVDESLTRPGEVMGTPEYMAPEQAVAADRVDARADVYSVGVILYEALTGQRPVEGGDPGELLERAVMGQSVPIEQRDASLPPGLVALVNQAIAADPDRRVQSAKDFRLRLSEFAGELSHAGQVAALSDPSVTLRPRAGSVAPPRSSTAVPSTVPPVDAGPPASLLLTEVPFAKPQQGSARPPKTQSMRAFPRRGVVAALVLLLCVFGAAAAAFVYLDPAILLPDEPPPPMPSAIAPDPIGVPELLDTDYDEPQKRGAERPRRGSSSAGTRGGNEGPSPAPQPTLPPLTLPSAFPTLPSGFPPMPSSLPTTLPQIPGLPQLLPPMAGAPAPTAASPVTSPTSTEAPAASPTPAAPAPAE